MLKLAKLAILAVVVATTSAASRPTLPAQPLIIAPLAIIEGGTVRTLPKGVKARGGKVVVLRARSDRGEGTDRAAAARRKPATPAAIPVRGRDAAPAQARSCACASGGGSASDVIDLRNTEQGLRVMIIGPDGMTRTRYVPTPPGSTARHAQDE